jgi:phospholipid/cholesterol/gamma-HCH transport system permease protein
MSNVFEIAGEVSVFGFRAVTGLFRRPFEGDQIRRQLAEIGSKSLPLVIASGFALGAVLTMHTRSTLVTFGATAWNVETNVVVAGFGAAGFAAFARPTISEPRS